MGESEAFLLESTFRFAAIFKAIEYVLCTAVRDASSKKKNIQILTYFEIFLLQKNCHDTI